MKRSEVARGIVQEGRRGEVRGRGQKFGQVLGVVWSVQPFFALASDASLEHKPSNLLISQAHNDLYTLYTTCRTKLCDATLYTKLAVLS
jgi:hypothetical protein